MTVTCNYRSTAVIILPGVYLPPQRNATVADDAFSLLFISIHAPREGSDRGALSSRERVENFNPRSPRGERLPDISGGTGQATISIHAPREGSDIFLRSSPRPLPISIHAPREGSDIFIFLLLRLLFGFQSTLPARGATLPKAGCRMRGSYFNPRSPRGERLPPMIHGSINIRISIHAPREGSDDSASSKVFSISISIHAPREGSDDSASSKVFSIRFQSTLPARGATR